MTLALFDQNSRLMLCEQLAERLGSDPQSQRAATLAGDLAGLYAEYTVARRMNTGPRDMEMGVWP